MYYELRTDMLTLLIEMLASGNLEPGVRLHHSLTWQYWNIDYVFGTE